jgi:hypothetical protein
MPKKGATHDLRRGRKQEEKNQRKRENNKNYVHFETPIPSEDHDCIVSVHEYKGGPTVRALFPSGDVKNIFISKINHNNFNSFLINLQDIISTSINEEGDYEYDIFKITINKLDDVSTNKIKVINPTIKEQDLYHIY